MYTFTKEKIKPKKRIINTSEIISAIRRRDEEALSYAYDAYSPSLLGIIVRIVGNPGLSEEILQQTFLKVWNNISTYNENHGTLFTWMASIARHTAIDKVRLKSFQQEQKTESFDINVYEGESHSTIENEIDAKAIIGLLDVKYKEVLDLIYLKGYSHVEAAGLLFLPVGTVKTRLRFGVNALRKKLKNEKGFFEGLLMLLLLVLMQLL